LEHYKDCQDELERILSEELAKDIDRHIMKAILRPYKLKRVIHEVEKMIRVNKIKEIFE